MSKAATTRAFREMAGLTQGGLARMLKVSKSTVKNWENPNCKYCASDSEMNALKALILARKSYTDLVLGGEKYMRNLKTLKIPLYWGQAEYEKATHTKNDYRVGNADNYALAQRLLELGYSVDNIEFDYRDGAE